MKKQSPLTPESFDRLLTWLDADRERAGKRYEEIRLALIKIFLRRGFSPVEEMADETINRVIKKTEELVGTYTGDPAFYFYGVAQKIVLEYARKKTHQISSQIADHIQAAEENAPCLQECLDNLEPESRWLILEYFQDNKQIKIDNRKALAQQLNTTAQALRMRVHRIKEILKSCILQCREREKNL